MFNRIRISTTLFLILILCGILQIGSNGMSFWAFRDDLQRLNQVEQSNQQRAALAQTRAVMLQASTALNKAGTLTALSYPADDIKTLMTTARASLTQSKEIKGLIEEPVNRVQQGSKLVNNAAATMTDIVSSVTRVNDIMGEIASASEEQRRGIEQVAQAVSQMDQVTQQNASLVEEARWQRNNWRIRPTIFRRVWRYLPLKNMK